MRALQRLMLAHKLTLRYSAMYNPPQIVPAGFTGDNLPVGISFFGPAFSEQKLLSLGYSFEQATRAQRRPVHTPALKGDSISVP